jgi:hypothetical protein
LAASLTEKSFDFNSRVSVIGSLIYPWKPPPKKALPGDLNVVPAEAGVNWIAAKKPLAAELMVTKNSLWTTKIAHLF